MRSYIDSDGKRRQLTLACPTPAKNNKYSSHSHTFRLALLGIVPYKLLACCLLRRYNPPNGLKGVMVFL